MRISVDKIGSVVRRLDLKKSVTLSPTIDSKPGAVLACRVLTDKSSYNQLEDKNGRMSVVQAGDVIIGALGHRNALHGYEGVVPESLKQGDTLNLLNLGGVMGISTSHHPAVGAPFQLEVLGQVLVFPEFQSRQGVPANISTANITSSSGASIPPVVMIAGTCMNSGKTAAACAIIRSITRAGYRTGGCKLTGISLIRDILNMQDHGADPVLDFTDTGVVTSSSETSVMSANTIFAKIAESGVQAIVAETGDGIFGEYGVQAILAEPTIKQQTKLFVLCANDPAGAVGAVEALQKTYGILPHLVTGPVTDNAVGRRFIEREFNLPAINAFAGAEFSDFITSKIQECLSEQ